jgi:two-component system, cell cycle sensor histidine kinase and response regulator CckA
MNGKSEFPGKTGPGNSRIKQESLAGPGKSWRRQAEILKDENSRLSSLLDAIDIGVNVQDKDHVILYENRFFRTLFGGLGRKCFQVYEHRDHPCDDCPVADAFHTGRPQQSERQVVDREGDKRVLILTATPFQGWNGIPAACTVVRDVTVQSQPNPQWQTSEESYRYLIENVNEVIYIVQDGRISFINRKGTGLTGFSTEEISSRPFIDFVHPEDRGIVMERHRRRIAGENPPDTYPFRVINREGQIRWVELRVSMITWKGRPATLNFLHDITDLKRAERRLAVMKRISNAFLTIADDELYDRVLRIMLDILESTCGVIGCLDEDADTLVFRASVGGDAMSDARRAPSIQKEKWNGFWGTIIREGKTIVLNRDMPVPAGHVAIERTICTPILDGGKPIGLIGLANRPCDYGEEDRLLLEGVASEMAPILRTRLERERSKAKRVSMEEALRQSEERFRGIFENAVEGIFQTRLDGRFVMANPALAQILGASTPEALTGNPALSMVQFYADSRHREELIRVLLKQRRDVRNFQTQLKRLDGSVVWVSINARLSSRFTDQEPLFDGTVEDISARKSLELQLLHSQKLDAIGTMAGGIAHDFNNILGIIIGFTEIIKSRKLPVSHKAQNDLEQVLQAALRARDLVKQILSFSRQEEQALRMIQIRPLVKEAARMLRATLPATIQIRTSIQADKEMILGDPTQIYQVLINLCTNAAYAMGDTIGTLSIALTTVVFSPGQVLPHIDLHPGAYQRLSISDTGEGIDPAIVGRIFEPFFTTKAVQVGSGLGLPVVHGIVKVHRGAVTVESELGRGATFHVYFPVAQRGVSETEMPPSDTSLWGQGRILLVDDEQILAEMTAETLANAGYEVTALNNPLEAVRWFGRHAEEVDLVITDQTMPGMTGLKMIEELRKRKPDIPVILCTGYSKSATQATLQQLGVKLIMKPVLSRDMVQAIKTLLPQGGSNG